MAGECHGNSCPMHLRARAKPARRVERDPICGAAGALKASAQTTPLAAQTASEHNHDAGASARDVEQGTSRQTFAGAASLARPCPSECCGSAAGAFKGARRQRGDATLSHNQRPRPPDSEPQAFAPSGFIKVASALRRLHPPRAPPHRPDTRTA